jgi:hypothetical protein
MKTNTMADKIAIAQNLILEIANDLHGFHNFDTRTSGLEDLICAELSTRLCAEQAALSKIETLLLPLEARLNAAWSNAADEP